MPWSVRRLAYRRPVSLLMPPTSSTDCALGDVAEKPPNAIALTLPDLKFIRCRNGYLGFEEEEPLCEPKQE